MFSEEDIIFSVCTALISVKLFFSIINTIPFSVIYLQRVTADLYFIDYNQQSFFVRDLYRL